MPISGKTSLVHSQCLPDMVVTFVRGSWSSKAGAGRRIGVEGVDAVVLRDDNTTL